MESQYLERQRAQRYGRGGCTSFPKLFVDVEVRTDSQPLYPRVKNGQVA